MTISTTSSAERTMAAINARRSTIQAMLDRVDARLRQMRRERAPITVAGLARRADVSRTFLYQNADACALVAKARAEADGQRVLDHTEQAAHVDAAWRERALNAEAALRFAHTEISSQRTTIGQLLGKIRDLEQDLPEYGPQRLIIENGTLKQQVRQLGQDNRRLDERLKGARDNNRFLDKRIADLEAQIADQLVADELGLSAAPGGPTRPEL